ncbi:MAG: PaaI family thioesterase [Candidatus Hydrogenedentota bacterium]
MTVERTYLPNSRGCFVCGEENHAGLRTRFFVEDGKVKAHLDPSRHHCGYENVVHGGVIAAILDESMGWAAARAIGRMCVTAELTVRYVRSVPADRPTIVETEIVKSNRLLALARGRIVDADGEEFARAEGKFIPLSPEQTLAVDDQLLYRGGEERLFDGLRSASNSTGRFPGSAGVSPSPSSNTSR